MQETLAADTTLAGQVPLAERVKYVARYLNLRVGYRARIGLRADGRSGPGWARQNSAQGGEQKALAGLPARAGGPGVREPGVGDRPVSRGAPGEPCAVQEVRSEYQAAWRVHSRGTRPRRPRRSTGPVSMMRR